MKRILLIFFLVSGYWFLVSPGYSQPVSSTELINNAGQYDNKAVTYQGEAIGDVMRRGEYAWVNIHDGENAIGIWLASNLADGILYTGSYQYIGDIVEVEGVFHRACPEHGGDLDIHAQKLIKIKSGRLRPERFNADKRAFALILAALLLIIWILTRFIRK